MQTTGSDMPVAPHEAGRVAYHVPVQSSTLDAPFIIRGIISCRQPRPVAWGSAARVAYALYIPESNQYVQM